MASDTIFNAIKELREELERLDQVIKSLESVAAGKARRGRPPKFMTETGKEPANGQAKTGKKKAARKGRRPKRDG